MIGIIGAMNEEVALLKTKMTDLQETDYYTFKFYQGKINDREIVLMKSGIGKVNAAVGTTLLFEHFKIDYVINIGTAGGASDNCEVLDIILSERVAYHDVDVTAFNYQYGQIPQCPLFYQSDTLLLQLTESILQKESLKYHKGLVVSGDSFIHEKKQISQIKGHFSDVIAVEMEAASIAQVCFIYKIPFIVIRCLSDIAGKKSDISFDTYLEKSSANSINLVIKLINELN